MLLKNALDLAMLTVILKVSFLLFLWLGGEQILKDLNLSLN